MIQVDNLTYRYGKGKEVLHGISFTVEKGEIFGFLGPNGSGKTTTQKILTGILKGYGGSVRVLGKEIREWDETLYHEIGVLFEFPYLYTSLSAIDNLRYFSSFYPAERRRDIGALLERVGLKKGFAKKKVASYSKGMKQRTSMARALVNSPIRIPSHPVHPMPKQNTVNQSPAVKNLILTVHSQSLGFVILKEHSLFFRAESSHQLALDFCGPVS
mgnify:CR=1 FL=1